MPAADGIRKNFALFLDGYGYAGKCDEFQPPNLEVQTESYRAGGMDAPVALDMGQNAMQATFKLAQMTAKALGLWGVSQGSTFPLIVRTPLEDLDGTVHPENFTCRGTVSGVNWDAVKAGAVAYVTMTMELRAFTYSIDGETIHDIDVLNMKRIINGVDRLAAQRNAMGI
jgi:hypothetical protein